MKKLLLLLILVIVVQCYGHYPLQDASVLGISQSVLRSISNFGWNINGQLQSHQSNSEPDVIVMIVEYQSDEANRKPYSSDRGWTSPQYGQPTPLHPPPPRSLPHSIPNSNNNFWYQQTYQSQYGKEPTKRPNRPLTSYGISQHNNYENQYFNNHNSEKNPGYYKEHFDTQTNRRPGTPLQGLWPMNNQEYAADTQFYETNQANHQTSGSNTPGFGNQNQFNQYPDNVNQGVESDQQYPNNGALNSGTQNPISNNPSDNFPTIPSSLPSGDKIAEEQEIPSFLPLNHTDTKMENENQKSEEEDEDFKIDVRFKEGALGGRGAGAGGGAVEALRRHSRQIAARRVRRVQFTEQARDGARGDGAESGGSEMSVGSGGPGAAVEERAHDRRPSTCRVELGALLAPEPRPPDNKVKRHSIHGMTEEENVVRPHQEMAVLSLEEKKYLLGVERGDVAGTRRVLQRARDTAHINVDCVDSLGRSALLMAIDNENLEMVELLLEFGVETRDALLHAISEEFVEAVEALLDHEESTRKPGELHSWEALPPETATFTADITPLILAAHRDSYEIIKLLLDRGAALPVPHDVRCGCDECVRSRREDSLRHSRSRINAYRALASPSLIALSSKDPILTAFELSWELRRLSALEHEFKTEYQELRTQCQEFATALLDHTRTSHELQVLLNHETGSPQAPLAEPGAPERMRLSRLKLAIKLRQKKFVAHPNVQQLLASIWYESVPGFRSKNMLLQAAEMVRIGVMFPFYSAAYIAAPHSALGRTLRKPFIKFLCHSASYFMFLFLLILASQRIETAASGLFGADPAPVSRRGSPPSLVEWLILSWVSGLIWSEVKQLWDMGLREYAHDMWNVIDFVTNSLYVATVALRVVSHFQVGREKAMGLQWNQPREKWDAWDPMLLSEGLFSAANIFSSLKLVYIFSVNPHLGPLQVSLSRMVLDILKFFVLDILVIFAFSCGLNQLLWYYADMEKKRCTSSDTSLANSNNTIVDHDACVVWRRFANLFETMQTLFWAAFGLVDLESFELDGIKIFTRFWGMLMFGTYDVINVIVLLNLLIAMMNHSYQLIFERADVEWKFARSKLWISYFEEGGTVPPPFNVVPSPKSILYAWRWLQRRLCGHARAKREHMRTIRRKAKQANERDFRYQAIMRNLVRRYVTVQQRRAESGGVTEDDVNEIKQDVSAFRCELVEILRNSGMNTSTANAGAPGGGGGKKNRQKERRLMKGFNISSGGPLAPVDEFLASLHHEHGAHPHHSSLSALLGAGAARLRTSQSSLSDAGAGGARSGVRRKPSSHKRRWETIIEAARAARVSRLIGRSRSEDSVCDHARPSPSGSERSDSGSDSQRSPERGRGGPLHPLTALAVLKRKRKKFSDSRRAPEVTPPPTVPEALQRASSVPARAPPAAPPRAARAAPPVSPSTTTESVAGKGGSREPLLASLDDDAHKEACGQCGYETTAERTTRAVERDAGGGVGLGGEGPVDEGGTCGRCAALARLAGVTPLHGHAPHHSAGWL